MKVLIVILCGSERANWICPQLVQWIMASVTAPALDMKTELFLLQDVWPVDDARNAAVERALAGGFDWLLMCDNDQNPHVATLDRIALAHARGLDMVGFFIPLTYRNEIVCSVFGEEIIDTGLDKEFRETAACGTGVVAIRTSVFARLTKPFFRITETNRDGIRERLGEDFSFCKKVRAAGFRVHVARRIIADHFKTVSLLRVLELQQQVPAQSSNDKKPQDPLAAFVRGLLLPGL